MSTLFREPRTKGNQKQNTDRGFWGTMRACFGLRKKKRDYFDKTRLAVAQTILPGYRNVAKVPFSAFAAVFFLFFVFFCETRADSASRVEHYFPCPPIVSF